MNLEFNKNEDTMKNGAEPASKIRFEKISLGGGKKAIEKQHEKNKLTARERIEYLIDKDSFFYRNRCICRL